MQTHLMVTDHMYLRTYMRQIGSLAFDATTSSKEKKRQR